MLCDAAGIPLAVVIDGANRHDVKLFEPTFGAIVMECPRPKRGQVQGVCLDKGYDSRSVRELLKDLGFETHIRSRGEEASDLKKKRTPRRVVGWLNAITAG